MLIIFLTGIALKEELFDYSVTRAHVDESEPNMVCKHIGRYMVSGFVVGSDCNISPPVLVFGD